MRRLTATTLAAALLTGCAMGASDVRPAMCDWLRVYSRDFQARAAGELGALPTSAALRVLVDDYGELRARIRAACGVGG